MSANTTAARSIITNFIGSMFERVMAGQVEMESSGVQTPLLTKIRKVIQSPGRIVLETGVFTITIDIRVQERVRRGNT